MSVKKIFIKKHLSTDDHIDLLKKRGLSIIDPDKAYHCLKTVSYYRLSAYFKPFLIPNNEYHLFIDGSNFERIWSIYVFDRELRLIVSDALERLEIALRASLSDSMTHKYGNLWYLSPNLFVETWTKPNPSSKKSQFNLLKNEINIICDKKKEDFIKHYYDIYREPSYPPSWMIIECLSFGKCTSIFRNLANLSDKKLVCKVFDYHPRVIESSLESLRYTRNLCAHHARLWNRWFVFSPKIFDAFGFFQTIPRSFHKQIFVISKLHGKVCQNSNWKKRLFNLFEKYDAAVPFHLMGFNNVWRNDHFWGD